MTKQKAKHFASNYKLRKVFSFITAFLLSLSLLGITVLAVVKNGLFSTETILKLMDEEYCTAVKTQAEGALSDYTIPTGIDTWVVEDVVSVADVTTDVKGYVYAAFAGNEYTPNTTLMDERIKENVVRFFEENSAELDDETSEIVDSFIVELNGVYTKAISLKAVSTVVKGNEVYSKFYMPSLIGLSLLSIALGYMCVKLHHYPHRGLRYVAYGVGGTALMSIIVPLIALASGAYKRLMFTPEHFYNLVVKYIQGFLRQFIWAGAIWIAAAAVIALMVYLLRTEKIKSKK